MVQELDTNQPPSIPPGHPRRPSRNRLTRGLMRLGAVCSIAVAAGAATIAPASAQTIDPPVPQPVIADTDSSALADMVNNYRMANGLNPLVVDGDFSSATAPHALLLSSLNPAPAPPAGYAFWCPEATPSTFYHDSNANQLASTPAGAVSYGENIAYRCSPTFNSHAADIMDGWRNSPGHDQNMLNPAWTHIASVAVRWNNTTIAVHRFAGIPGTPVPTTAATSDAGDDSDGRSLDPANDGAPTSTDPTSTESAPADSVSAGPANGEAPTADPAAATTSDSEATDSSSDAGAAGAPAEGAAPQLAFTGTNLNLALFGLALIGCGLGVLALPAVRHLDDEG